MLSRTTADPGSRDHHQRDRPPWRGACLARCVLDAPAASPRSPTAGPRPDASAATYLTRERMLSPCPRAGAHPVPAASAHRRLTAGRWRARDTIGPAV